MSSPFTSNSIGELQSFVATCKKRDSKFSDEKFPPSNESVSKSKIASNFNKTMKFIYGLVKIEQWVRVKELFGQEAKLFSSKSSKVI